MSAHTTLLFLLPRSPDGKCASSKAGADRRRKKRDLSRKACIEGSSVYFFNTTLIRPQGASNDLGSDSNLQRRRNHLVTSSRPVRCHGQGGRQLGSRIR